PVPYSQAQLSWELHHLGDDKRQRQSSGHIDRRSDRHDTIATELSTSSLIAAQLLKMSRKSRNPQRNATAIYSSAFLLTPMDFGARIRGNIFAGPPRGLRMRLSAASARSGGPLRERACSTCLVLLSSASIRAVKRAATGCGPMQQGRF